MFQRLLNILSLKSLVGTKNKMVRDEWIQKVLSSLPANSRILDAGAGECQYKKSCTHLNYVSQDFGQYDGFGNNKGLQTGSWDQIDVDLVCDITAIPESDSSFDAILCTEVFEHLPAPIKAIEEFSRLLRPDGELIITAPFCSLTHFAPYYFYSGFSRYFFEYWLEKYDFVIIEMVPNGNFFEFLAQEFRRMDSVKENYVFKNSLGNILCTALKDISKQILLKQLELLSAKDSSSSELLCFGYHLRAKRNSKLSERQK